MTKKIIALTSVLFFFTGCGIKTPENASQSEPIPKIPVQEKNTPPTPPANNEESPSPAVDSGSTMMEGKVTSLSAEDFEVVVPTDTEAVPPLVAPANEPSPVF